MKQEEKKNMLDNYIEANIAPILLQDIPMDIREMAVILPGNCGVDELNGHYEEISFLPPLWYQRVKEREKSRINILIIEGLSEVSKEEQMKFYEILKYRKISTFELPKNCVILIEHSLKPIYSINPVLYSLMAHIEG